MGRLGNTQTYEGDEVIFAGTETAECGNMSDGYFVSNQKSPCE
jgi:hypothetical protein